MPLAPGTRLGSYEVVSAIGAGGMGEVYRARDTRLDRAVAIKILPPSLAADAEARERFEREARSVAALNHPHICVVHDVGHQDGTDFLVMEYLEGETVAERLQRGALPLEQALRHGIEIADALAKAHGAGIVHRDVKPGNIMLARHGGSSGSVVAKLLDFGLAKAVQPAAAAANMSMLPTTPPLTQQGAILGTFQYMSPEQLEGREADSRTDIFALGAVLYEMVTGRKAFEGKTQASLIGAIMRADPPSISQIQSLVPRALDRVVTTCLAKDPEDRWQSARDLARELRWIARHDSVPTSTAAGVTTWRRLLGSARVAWAVAALCVIGLIGGFAIFSRTPSDAQTMRFSVSSPDGWRLTLRFAETSAIGGTVNPLAVSADGRFVAFLATGATGRSRLWVRSLDSLTARELPGTDGATGPFWSPDSRFIGFFADRKLKRIDVTGGSPITICDTPDYRGGSWGKDGTIVFSPGSLEGLRRLGLQKVPASGGTPETATTLAEGETAHSRPSFLPDGRHFLYLTADGVWVGSLDSPDRSLLIKSNEFPEVMYRQGYLLFVREATLMAQQFDTSRLMLSGEPVVMAEGIRIAGTYTGNGVFSASDNGVLAYHTGPPSYGSQLVWFDRSGKRTGIASEHAGTSVFADVSLSPRGDRAMVTVFDPRQATASIGLVDLERQLLTRLTVGQRQVRAGSWAPDGSRIVYAAPRGNRFALYQRSSSGGGDEEVLIENDRQMFPLGGSRDGRYLVYASTDAAPVLYVLPLFGDRKPIAYLSGPSSGPGQISPDGRWISYVSLESGPPEVYVAPRSDSARKVRISPAGGSAPRWRGDGRELFYLSTDSRLVAVAVDGRGEIFKVGAVEPLFGVRPGGGRYTYDVAPDGQRFLFSAQPVEDEPTATPITVVLNWTADLKR